MTDPPDNSLAVQCTDLPVVMILGDRDRAEMHRLMNWLEYCICPSSRRILVSDISEALNQNASDLFLNMIIVLQSWPDEYAREEINNLLAFAPLARIVVCYGAWCESDGRNHSLWPQSIRVPLWAAQSRIEREWRLIQNPSHLQPLPWSASRDETFAADHRSIEQAANPYSFLVDSPDSAFRQSVIEIMVEAGHKPVCDQPAVLLIDLDPWNECRAAAVRELTERYPRATAFAVANLLPPSMPDELRGFGVTQFSAKLGFCPPLL